MTHHIDGTLIYGRKDLARLVRHPGPRERVFLNTKRDRVPRPARVLEHVQDDLYRVAYLADYETSAACKNALRRLTQLGCKRKRSGRRILSDGSWIEIVPLSGEDGRGLIRIKTSNDRELTVHVSEDSGMIVRSALALVAGLQCPWWTGGKHYAWSLDAVVYSFGFGPYTHQAFR